MHICVPAMVTSVLCVKAVQVVAFCFYRFGGKQVTGFVLASVFFLLSLRR